MLWSSSKPGGEKKKSLSQEKKSKRKKNKKSAVLLLLKRSKRSALNETVTLTKSAVISYSYKQMPHWRKWGKKNSYEFNLRVKIR